MCNAIIISKEKGGQHMAKNNDTGLFQLPNGNWGYRVTITKNGKKTDTTFRRDEQGNPFTRKTDAKRAREQKILEYRKPEKTEIFTDCKLREMWDCYLEKVAPGKAPSTVRKYTSLWTQHIGKEFGDTFISEINISDLHSYLQELYNSGLSYKYVEGFLKLFYQLFGIAYSEEKIDPLRYTRMFIDKGTKLKMPKISQEDYEDYEKIKTFNSYEINQISQIFEQGNCYTAFLLGYMCGLRIAETFGLLWSDYNWDTHQLTVCRQMTYEDGCFCLRPVKTLKSSRVIDVPEYLHKNLIKKIRQQKKHSPKSFTLRASEIVLDKTKGKTVTEIQGGDFINRKENGDLLTINSIKYYSKKIKAETGIDFNYHALRKTHLTFLANQNIPAIEVMNRAGHKKFETTMKYYVNQSEESRLKLLETLNKISTEEQEIEIPDGYGGTKLVKESSANIFKRASAMIPH